MFQLSKKFLFIFVVCVVGLVSSASLAAQEIPEPSFVPATTTTVVPRSEPAVSVLPVSTLVVSESTVSTSTLAVSTTTSVASSAPTTSSETTVPVETSVPSLVFEPQATMNELTQKYRSLSSALTGHYAVQSDMSLTSFLINNAGRAQSLTGSSFSNLPANVEMTVDSFDQYLDNQELTLDPESYLTLNDFARDVANKSDSIDAQVIKASSQWANESSSLRSPSLAAPRAPGVDPNANSGVAADSLVFGMFFDRSLTALVSDFPDVFSQAGSAGLGTESSMGAWRQSMLTAADATNQDFSSLMPSPCVGVMLTVMASGNAEAASSQAPAGSDCSPCVAGGLYMNQKLEDLFSGGGIQDPFDYNDIVITEEEWLGADPWLQDLVDPEYGANFSPESHSAKLFDASNKGSGCASASSGVAATADSALPGVFGKLSLD